MVYNSIRCHSIASDGAVIKKCYMYVNTWFRRNIVENTCAIYSINNLVVWCET